jgi:hypothetical protein
VTNEITAAIVEELDGPFQWVTLELDEPGPGEVLVRLVATGMASPARVDGDGDRDDMELATERDRVIPPRTAVEEARMGQHDWWTIADHAVSFGGH